MENKIKIIGITGHMRTGKDTFFALLQKINPHFKRYSFADALKSDLRGFVWEKMGIDVNTAVGADKELIRPLMIAYGCAQRNRGDGLHWVRRVDSQIVNDLEFDSDFSNPVEDGKLFPVITDFRFENEVKYFKEIYDLILVEIQRENAPNPPDEEKMQQPLVRNYVNYTINWPTVGENNINILHEYAEKFMKDFNLV
jgi:predicted AAA+ superfamily ATPase